MKTQPYKRTLMIFLRPIETRCTKPQINLQQNCLLVEIFGAHWICFSKAKRRKRTELPDRVKMSQDRQSHMQTHDRTSHYCIPFRLNDLVFVRQSKSKERRSWKAGTVIKVLMTDTVSQIRQQRKNKEYSFKSAA